MGVVRAILAWMSICVSAYAYWPYDAVCEIVGKESTTRDGKQYMDQGTGVLIGKASDRVELVVSAAHVVRDARPDSVTCTFYATGKTYPARIIHSDSVGDMVALVVPATGIRPASGVVVAKKGDALIKVGYPLNQHKMVVSRGKMTATASFGKGRVAMVVSGVVEEGASGGPMFDSEGYVAGTITGTFDMNDDQRYDSTIGPSGSTFVKFVNQAMAKAKGIK